MSLRDEVKEWLQEGKEIKAKNPLCSKRLVVEHLSEISKLLEHIHTDYGQDTRLLAKEKIKSLMEDIVNTDKLDAGKLR
jgi:hypothetical protein|tara:strand:- start:592 stop:828 length:237 start_codon:yes stop_codon:yes gene_type:complete